MKPIYQSLSISQSPIAPQTRKIEPDTPIHLAQSQITARPTDTRTITQDIIAASQQTISSAPLALPVVSPQSKHSHIATPESELAIPCPRNQRIASAIRTSTQDVDKAFANILDKIALAIESNRHPRPAPAKMDPHMQPLPFRGPATEHTSSSQPASTPACPAHCIKVIAYTPASHNVKDLVNAPTSSLDIAKYTATAPDASISIDKAPSIAFADLESAIVCASSTSSYISPSSVPT